MENNWLLDFSRNVTSQCGEDGILEKVFELIPATGLRWCVEFGAGKGLDNSNTRHLIYSRGWHSVQIEADPYKFSLLQPLYATTPRVVCRNCRVGWSKFDSLDGILEGMGVPQDIDLLSIDIDGNDYHAFNAIAYYRPKCVLIEFNPTFPPWREWVQVADPSVNQGSSLMSLCDLGKAKGYELVCATKFNAILVLNQYFPLFNIADNNPPAMWPYLDALLCVAKGYDGTLIPVGNMGMIWHPLKIETEAWKAQIQVIPEELRSYSGKLKTQEKTGNET